MSFVKASFPGIYTHIFSEGMLLKCICFSFKDSLYLQRQERVMTEGSSGNESTRVRGTHKQCICTHTPTDVKVEQPKALTSLERWISSLQTHLLCSLDGATLLPDLKDISLVQKSVRWRALQWCTPNLTKDEVISTTPSLKRPEGLSPSSMKMSLYLQQSPFSKTGSAFSKS